MTGLESIVEYNDLSRSRTTDFNDQVHFENINKKSKDDYKDLKKSSNDSNESVNSVGIAELLINAKLLFGSQDYSLAQILLRKVLAINSRNPNGIRLMAMCLMKEKKYIDSIKCFNELLKIQEFASDHYYLASCYNDIQQDQDSYNHYIQSLEFGLNDKEQLFETYKNIGNILLRANDPEGAEENYNRAFTIKPNSPILHVNYGTLMIQKGKYEEAVLRFRNAVNIDPECEMGWVGLALVHHEKGDLELSIGNLERALDINPFNTTALELFTAWGRPLNMHSRLIARWVIYLKENDQDFDRSILFTELLLESGQIHLAKIEIERASMLSPKDHRLQGLINKINSLNI